MSVRANWYADAAELPEQHEDPFDNVGAGKKAMVGLNSSSEEFRNAFSKLAKRFARLDKMGITCPLRDAGECHCSSCPISQVNDPDGQRRSLCKAGVEEERLVMLARVSTLGLAPSGV